MSKLILIALFACSFTSIYCNEDVMLNKSDNNLRFLLEESEALTHFLVFLKNFYISTTHVKIESCPHVFPLTASELISYVKSYNRLSDTVKSNMKMGNPKINGLKCDYIAGDTEQFVSAKKARFNPTSKTVFKDFLQKNSVSVFTNTITNCLDKNGYLKTIMDVSYLNTVIDIVNNTNNLLDKLFESFCTINNIFSYLKEDVVDDLVFTENIGKILAEIFVLIKPHLDYINPK